MSPKPILGKHRVFGGLWDRWLTSRLAPGQSRPTADVKARDPRSSLSANSGMFAVVDALPDAALVLGASLDLVHGNALAREVFGPLRLGQHISLTTRNPELAAAVAQALSSDERILFELNVRGPIERRLEGTATSLNQLNGAWAGPAILVILQDLSERDALTRMRVEFIANASHELRTPLASLSGFIETLSGPAKNDPAARERFLGIMSEQAARMRRLIDDLLVLSRVEMRAHLAPTAVVDLNLVMSDAVAPLKAVAAQNNITLTALPSDTAMRVRGDHDELIQAIQNLVQNAIKYGRAGGSVAVQVSAGASPPGQDIRARLSVTDDGPGIPAEHLPRLTERFYRVNTASSREKGGTGLGFAIVKHIASRHWGRLEIVSEPDRGSTFTLSLPLA